MNNTSISGFPGARFFGHEELIAVKRVLDSQSPYRFYGLNKPHFAEDFEKEVAKQIGRTYVLALSSGTAALHSALISLNIQAGDEVIIPAYGWVSDLMVILAVGGIPVIAPIDRSLGLDPQKLTNCINEQTKAVIAIHMRGNPCNIEALQNLCNNYSLYLIEDSCQCFGGKIGARATGSFGHISIFSFQANKMITSGEGGAFLTDNAEIYKRARSFHDNGMLRQAGERDPMGESSLEGFGLNYRLSEIQAAILGEQLKKLPLIQENLKKNYELIDSSAGVLEYGEPNGAFKLAKFDTFPEDRRWQCCGTLDAHHYRSWEHFMQRKKYSYKSFVDDETNQILRTTYFMEISSYPQLSVSSE
jgi:8-amino-3,8-dideoxy-alpha-D-manno-octulosonate transaminase